MTKKILLVEDEKMLSDTLAAYLQKEGFEVEQVEDGALVMSVFERQAPNLVLLDLMLPNVDGISLCRQIRQVSNVPIIMLTARVDEIDKLLGLEIGADDYVCKPYSPREVVARAKAQLRRNGPELSQPATAQTSGLRIDEASMDASWNGVSLALTTIEFRLLWVMANEPRRVFSREQLMEKIYNDQRIVNDRTIDSHINKLRQKLSKVSNGEEIVRSVYGAGYKFERPA